MQHNLEDYIPSNISFKYPLADAELLMYKNGGVLTPHYDTFSDPWEAKSAGKGGHPRILTFCLYLNKDWKEEHGGKFTYGLNEQLYSVPPTFGTLALFDSYRLPHSGDPVFFKKKLFNIFLHVKKDKFKYDLD